jgi:hypothetical protein
MRGAPFLAVLAVALGASGCTEILSLGFAHEAAGKHLPEIRAIDPALVRGATLDGRQRYDRATCARACPVSGDLQLHGCAPVTIAPPPGTPGPPPPETTYVLCEFHWPGGAVGPHLSHAEPAGGADRPGT